MKIKSWALGFLLVLTAGITVYACGYGIEVTEGDNAGACAACQANDSGVYPSGNVCNYDTYSPQILTCGSSSTTTGQTCSQSSSNTPITDTYEVGACDGHGACDGGKPTGADPTVFNVQQAFLTTCSER